MLIYNICCFFYFLFLISFCLIGSRLGEDIFQRIIFLNHEERSNNNKELTM